MCRTCAPVAAGSWRQQPRMTDFKSKMSSHGSQLCCSSAGQIGPASQSASASFSDPCRYEHSRSAAAACASVKRATAGKARQEQLKALPLHHHRRLCMVTSLQLWDTFWSACSCRVISSRCYSCFQACTSGELAASMLARCIASRPQILAGHDCYRLQSIWYTPPGMSCLLCTAKK